MESVLVIIFAVLLLAICRLFYETIKLENDIEKLERRCNIIQMWMNQCIMVDAMKRGDKETESEARKLLNHFKEINGIK